MKNMDISVVIPVLNEEENLKPLCSRLTKVLSSLKPPEADYEILFVDDGSTDSSFQILKDLVKEDSHVRVIRLTRNFGQHPAILAGFERARGEIIITLDADLQNPPEEIPKLLRKMDEGYDVVAGWRKKRKDASIRRLISNFLNRITSSLVGSIGRTPLHDYGSMLRVYRRPVVDRILKYGGKSLFLPTLVAAFGERIAEVEVEHWERKRGVSKYGLLGMTRIYFDLISGLTLYPFQLFMLLGGLLFLTGSGLGIFVLLRRLLSNPETQGIFFPFSAFFFVFFGILLIAVGVLGEYLGRIYKEVSPSRPFHVQEVIGRGDRPVASTVRIAYFGYGEMGYACLEKLIMSSGKTNMDVSPHKIFCVVTHMDDPKEKIWFRSVRDLAFKNLIPVFAPDDVNRPEFIQVLKETQPDLILSVQYRQILSHEILTIPRLGCVNLHPSLLPKYRGRAPINWAIIQGEEKTGVTLHYMNQVPDSGDVIAQKEVFITIEDTAFSLYQKLVPEAVNLLGVNLPLIKEGQAPGVPQKEEEATHFGRRRPEDGRILWEKSSEEIRNLVHGVTHPFPGAFTYWDGKKVFVWKARGMKDAGIPGQTSTSKSAVRESGTVIGIEDGGIVVVCGRGALLIEKAELEGFIEVQGKVLAKKLGFRIGSKFT